MAEREDNVYKAKLAEQAERYDGEEWNRIADNKKMCQIFLGVDSHFLNCVLILNSCIFLWIEQTEN